MATLVVSENDQSNDYSNATNYQGGDIVVGNEWPSTSKAFTLEYVNTFLRRESGADGNCWIEIWNADRTALIANGTSNTVASSTLSDSGAVQQFTWSSGSRPSISNATGYHFMLCSDSTDTIWWEGGGGNISTFSSKWEMDYSAETWANEITDDSHYLEIYEEDSGDTELVVADIDIDLAFDAPSLISSNTVLAVANIDIDLEFAGGSTGDGLWDLGAFIYPDGTSGIVLVTGEVVTDTELVIADISLALSYEAPVLTQAHTLVVDDIAHALAFEAPVLTQAHTLVVADAAIDLAFDAPVLTQGHDFSATVAAVTTTGSVTLDITHDFSATVAATFSTGAATVVTVTTDEFSATVAASFTTGAAILATGAPINSIDSTITSVTTARTITSSTTARTITSSTTARTTTSSTTARTINSK